MKEKGGNGKRIIRIVCIVLFAGCILSGLLMGHYRDSHARASAICWECIGLGE